ncbi:hypothetical protein L596_010671 [Steinernema carpocapsae]|uniref:Uncharacterized protein n=1 Tax=Steinernema carpocapsae TaxID=34508 RepID=A0A4U5PJ86_STECR|nr:hypothetical protein L596_010671 [Steinernema carpocapsae]
MRDAGVDSEQLHEEVDHHCDEFLERLSEGPHQIEVVEHGDEGVESRDSSHGHARESKRPGVDADAEEGQEEKGGSGQGGHCGLLY